jgi:hypothetical protein
MTGNFAISLAGGGAVWARHSPSRAARALSAAALPCQKRQIGRTLLPRVITSGEFRFSAEAILRIRIEV